MSFNQEYKEQFKTYANPMILRSIFESLMHTADKLIAGIFIGSTALVATTLVSPLMFFLAAIARLFISGLGAYIGLLIGRNNIKKANQTASSILLFLLFLGIVLIIPPFFFSNEFVYLLGARGIFKDLAADYIKIFSLSFPFLLVGRGMDALILNDDSPKFSFVLNIITTSSNLIFNIIAVAVFDFGIKGLAFATVISCILEFLGGIYYFLNKSKTIKLTLPKLQLNTFIRISYNGLSDFSMMLVESVMVYIINITFVKFLTPSHFEAYASVSIIFTIFYGIYMGASIGLQPYFSKMVGGKIFTKLKGMINYSIRKTIFLGIFIYLILIPFINPIMSLFIDNPNTINLAYFFYLTIGLATLFSNYPLQMSIFFTSINRPLESAFISIARTLILIPIMIYMSVKSFGALGVSIGFIVADIIMFVQIYIYMKKIDLSTLKIYE